MIGKTANMSQNDPLEVAVSNRVKAKSTKSNINNQFLNKTEKKCIP